MLSNIETTAQYVSRRHTREYVKALSKVGSETAESDETSYGRRI